MKHSSALYHVYNGTPVENMYGKVQITETNVLFKTYMLFLFN